MPHPKFTPTFHNAPYPRISPSDPRLSCSGKTVVVTGGGRGIGRAIAVNFAIAGANVFIIGRSEASLRDTVVELSELTASSPATSKPQFDYHAADASDQESVQSAIAAAVETFGRIDVMVNNAGYLDSHRPISSSDLKDYWTCYEVNVKAGVITVQEFLKIAKPGATFINVSSGAAHIPRISNYSAYSSSKMAFARICEYVQGENEELRVFSIQPGSIETDMAKKARDLTPCDDIRDLPGAFCVWLASDEADFLKGKFVWANWDVDELMEKKDVILKNDILTMRLSGWPDGLRE